MAHRGQVLDNGRLTFLTTAKDSDGELHEMQVRYAPDSPLPPAHRRPAQAERFEVHEGELWFLVDGVEHVVGAGQGIDLPAGCVHQARNRGAVPVVASWQTVRHCGRGSSTRRSLPRAATAQRSWRRSWSSATCSSSPPSPRRADPAP